MIRSYEMETQSVLRNRYDKVGISPKKSVKNALIIDL